MSRKSIVAIAAVCLIAGILACQGCRLVAKDSVYDVVVVAGRAVSSDHGANSALRVQASCMGMGQAAGMVAALASERHCDPREVPLELIRQHLAAIGHIVPGGSQDRESMK